MANEDLRNNPGHRGRRPRRPRRGRTYHNPLTKEEVEALSEWVDEPESKHGAEKIQFKKPTDVDAFVNAIKEFFPRSGPSGKGLPGPTVLAPKVRFSTLEDIDTGTGGGTWAAKVRPFTDDDTALASGIGDVTTILDALPDGFSVTNAAAITRLSAAQLDARYGQAIDKTLDPSSVSFRANAIQSARGGRSSINLKLKENAASATASGLSARKYSVRPPLGTTRAVAKGATPGIGVGSIRDQRGTYHFPGFTTIIPEIQSVGATVGGAGFTDDGVIEVGSEGFYGMVRSILNPEENAGQDLSDTNVSGIPVLSLEDAYNPEQGGITLDLTDYKSFKAAGIIAPRFDRDAGAVFQSDVTSVDPANKPSLVDANRRYFADFIIDTTLTIGIRYAKKLGTPNRHRALKGDLNGFLEILKSPDQPEASRLLDFSVVDTSTDALKEAGISVYDIKVKMHSTLKALVFRVEVGAAVTIEEAA